MAPVIAATAAAATASIVNWTANTMKSNLAKVVAVAVESLLLYGKMGSQTNNQMAQIGTRGEQ